ncbi:hypothetical protein NGRA_2267 [Nosema granulosis]|uniref:Uncharacterized protein n=1 Tax=Nosema granulosis TaxID=83296 RepID=A0A9P6H080_9MICR|nr:hypothetical protein NGRA_2267 [Nosema granulosis]
MNFTIIITSLFQFIYSYKAMLLCKDMINLEALNLKPIPEDIKITRFCVVQFSLFSSTTKKWHFKPILKQERKDNNIIIEYLLDPKIESSMDICRVINYKTNKDEFPEFYNFFSFSIISPETLHLYKQKMFEIGFNKLKSLTDDVPDVDTSDIKSPKLRELMNLYKQNNGLQKQHFEDIIDVNERLNTLYELYSILHNAVKSNKISIGQLREMESMLKTEKVLSINKLKKLQILKLYDDNNDIFKTIEFEKDVQYIKKEDFEDKPFKMAKLFKGYEDDIGEDITEELKSI